jgi:hypothetical protein
MNAGLDPMFEEEPCHYCDGDGCDACNETGLLYTESAIALQIVAEDEANRGGDA